MSAGDCYGVLLAIALGLLLAIALGLLRPLLAELAFGTMWRSAECTWLPGRDSPLMETRVQVLMVLQVSVVLRVL
jgi:hypothetical protein